MALERVDFEPGTVIKGAIELLTSSTTGQENPIDSQVLDGLRELQTESRPGVLQELIEAYLSNSTVLLTNLRAAARQGDASALYLYAHRFKGSSASFGAVLLAKRCAELEACGRAGAVADAWEQLKAIESEYERARQVLEAEIAASFLPAARPG